MSRQFAASAGRRFEFHKRGQRFIRAHNETLSVAAMGVSNPNCGPSSSRAEIQPMLNPTLIILLAMISQNFIQTLLA
jgi:hypothetical protein